MTRSTLHLTTRNGPRYLQQLAKHFGHKMPVIHFATLPAIRGAVIAEASATDAQAAMDSFGSAPAAAEFMGMMDVTTMAMTRYDLN